MPGKLHIDIAESAEELRSLLLSTSNAGVKEKLQALYWLKSGYASQATQEAFRDESVSQHVPSS
ncbi:hypothetical protein KR51_00001710 [Rubidibacter lacunae KORDI 51-2]|uniref:Uncharacterized protein n=1 Tax=Rubidibacter lacunae KORDI 51-2 TaxID=582515 RepID=U5DF41_9CHRO|nr:hypothetical protein [Rubidibacter lacunae]ERN43103.1 hypothetical protein KR51_00001710 [Rubidibacter lacunae KORDI 51-2]